ncbi:MAG: hypothetical protein FJ301_00355 [Planctomycetes bacterium]|nr:hypothetical protein [Planctomycetota bacterium]
MRLCLYLHPFDLRALAGHGGLARIRDLGCDEVAIAASYHDGRWLMPWHPEGRVRFLEDGTVHFRPRADYGELRPLPSAEVPIDGPSPLDSLCAEASAVGLQTRAWTVFTHNSRLGARRPDLCVRNALGDVYPYALCPAQPVVQRHIAALAQDVGAHQGLQTIELEALGQMGWKHSSHHDKASFSPSGLLDAALSACFCRACVAQIKAAGHDPVAAQAAAQAYIESALADGDALAPGKHPGNPVEAAAAGVAIGWLDAVLAGRAATARALAALVAQNTPRVARAVQVHPHPWFTGSQFAADAAAAFAAGDERVITAYGEGPDAIGRMLAAASIQAARRGGAPLRVCVWPKAPQFAGDDDLAKLRETCRANGVGAIAVYHLGLLPWRTVERVAKILRA